jgi:hypothetical protein
MRIRNLPLNIISIDSYHIFAAWIFFVFIRSRSPRRDRDRHRGSSPDGAAGEWVPRYGKKPGRFDVMPRPGEVLPPGVGANAAAIAASGGHFLPPPPLPAASPASFFPPPGTAGAAAYSAPSVGVS